MSTNTEATKGGSEGLGGQRERLCGRHLQGRWNWAWSVRITGDPWPWHTSLVLLHKYPVLPPPTKRWAFLPSSDAVLGGRSVSRVEPRHESTPLSLNQVLPQCPELRNSLRESLAPHP